MRSFRSSSHTFLLLLGYPVCWIILTLPYFPPSWLSLPSYIFYSQYSLHVHQFCMSFFMSILMFPDPCCIVIASSLMDYLVFGLALCSALILMRKSDEAHHAHHLFHWIYEGTWHLHSPLSIVIVSPSSWPSARTLVSQTQLNIRASDSKLGNGVRMEPKECKLRQKRGKRSALQLRKKK